MNSKQIGQVLSAHPSLSSFRYFPASGEWGDGANTLVPERIVRVAVTKALAASGQPFTGASIAFAIDLLKTGVRS